MDETTEVKRNIGFGKRGMILIIGTLASMFVVGSATISGLNLAIPQLEAQYGYSSTLMYTVITIVGYVQFAFLLLMGWVIKRWPRAGKWTAAIGILAAGVGIAICGMASHFWIYVASRCFCQLGGGAAVYYGFSTLVVNWFPRRRGQVMGIVTLGYNLSGLTINWILMGLFNTVGTRGGFLVWACFALIPFILVLFIKEFPEDCGQFPDNDNTVSREELDKVVEEEEKINKNTPWTVGKLLKSKTCWAIIIGIGLLMMATSMMSFLVPVFMWHGASVVQATLYMTIASAIAMPMSVLLGFLDTKFGTKVACIIVAAISAAGMFLLGSPGFVIIMWIGIICFSFLNGTTNNMMTSLTGYIYGRYDYKSAYAVIYPIMSLVYNSGFAVISQIQAATGSYQLPFYIMGGACVVGLIIFIAMKGKMIGRKTPDEVLEV